MNCTIWLSYRTSRCGRPGTVPAQYICVHEHMESDWVCDLHGASDRLLYCIPCEEAGCEHCPVTRVAA